MSARRCPSCGGLVGADAEWCGQCFAPLGDRARPRPEPTSETSPPPAAEQEPSAAASRPTEETSRLAGDSAIRVEGERVVWDCPRCGTENPIEARTCSSCGAPFGQLFEAESGRPEVPASRAVRLSLLFPGLGHAALGRGAEGLARGVVFAYAAVTAVAILVMRSGSGLGPFLALFVITALAAAAFYALAAVDAARLAEGRPQILSSRGLLYGATGLILLTIAVLVVTGIRASPG